jgi:hypothetical protein
MFKKLILILIFIFDFAFLITGASAKDSPLSYIPEDLKTWKQWVLYQKDNEFCPFNYHNVKNKHCHFLSTGHLNIDHDGGTFSLRGISFTEQWMNIPGQSNCWPTFVKNNNLLLPVLERHNHPAIFLPEGEFHVTGNFLYDQIPESIWIPVNTGLLSLTLNGQNISEPFVTNNHNLWLNSKTTKMPKDQRLHIRIYRLITDDIPMTMTHCFQLSVSGQSREELFNQVLPEDSRVVNVISSLPVQIEKNRHLRVHVRPGKWELFITTRFCQPVYQLTSNFLLEKSETWSFESKNQFRMVKLMNVKGTDPKNVGVPKQWQHYPAYTVLPDQSIIFQEQRRGDPDPPPDQLSLNRTIWLDFEGTGYTIHDSLKGTIHKNWRLNMKKDIQLGRVSFSDHDQLITTDSNNQTGVEIRTGQLSMSSDARYIKSIRKIPAIGWDHSMNHLKANLHLPPGWRLISATGVDTLSGSWFGQWRLIDFFIALIIVMAIYHLNNTKWAILGLLTMILTFHEPSAPQLTWLHLLAIIALLRVVPEGRLQSFVRFWFVCAVVLFGVYVLPFMLNQIRSGIFPQLEKNGQQQTSVRSVSFSQKTKPLSIADHFMLASPQQKVMSGQQNTLARKQYSKRDKNISDAVVQTGPGLPKWEWHSIQLNWNGPVDKCQMIQLWLIPPYMNCFFSLLRVIMVAGLLMGIARYRHHPIFPKP